MADEIEITVQRGGKEPLPSPELDLGNVVRLKKPFDGFQFGIIAQHVGRNAWGIPKVSLYLFDDSGKMDFFEGTHIPESGDFVASEIVVLNLAASAGKSIDGVFHHGAEVLCDGDGFDLYPMCPGCGDKDQHPFADDEESICPQCGGWGHVKQMRRIADLGK